MKNPFSDFRPQNPSKDTAPVERIARGHEDMMERIRHGYLDLATNEMDALAWPIESDRIFNVYHEAVVKIQGLGHNLYDIEEFCSELDRGEELHHRIPGPDGLFISALINHARERRVVIRLKDYQRSFHFMGFGLLEGRVLILQGDAGDFCGAGLRGGRLMVEGSVGHFCGAGMLDGEISVKGKSGLSTGKFMHGGRIDVDGIVEGMGDPVFGGTIYQEGQRLFSPEQLS